MRHQTFMIILASILLASCEQKKKPLSFYGNEEVVEDTTEVVQSQAASQVSYDADSEVSSALCRTKRSKAHRCDRK